MIFLPFLGVFPTSLLFGRDSSSLDYYVCLLFQKGKRKEWEIASDERWVCVAHNVLLFPSLTKRVVGKKMLPNASMTGPLSSFSSCGVEKKVSLFGWHRDLEIETRSQKLAVTIWCAFTSFPKKGEEEDMRVLHQERVWGRQADRQTGIGRRGGKKFPLAKAGKQERGNTISSNVLKRMFFSENNKQHDLMISGWQGVESWNGNSFTTNTTMIKGIDWIQPREVKVMIPDNLNKGIGLRDGCSWERKHRCHNHRQHIMSISFARSNRREKGNFWYVDVLLSCHESSTWSSSLN